jgi:hypothetical protein
MRVLVVEELLGLNQPQRPARLLKFQAGNAQGIRASLDAAFGGRAPAVVPTELRLAAWL